MKNTNIMKLIDDELDKEAKRIFEILMKLYKEKKIVNKLFSDLIKENIDDRYLFFYSKIEKKIIKLIPIGLNICPTGKWVFITDKELMTMHEKAYTYDEKKMINKFMEECVKDIKALKYDNLFTIVENNKNKYLNNLYLLDYTYILEVINDKLKSEHISIISIDPLKLKNED